MRYINIIICVGIALAIGFILGYEQPTVTPVYEQQNVDVADLHNLANTTTPTPDVLMSFTLQHIDKSTTTFNVITFSTTTNVGGFYKHSDGSINVRVYNWEKIKRLGEKEKDVPIISTSVLIHEIVHMTTLYNTRDIQNACVEINNNVLQEKMAYDAGNIYEQVRSFEEDGWIKLTKD